MDKGRELKKTSPSRRWLDVNIVNVDNKGVLWEKDGIIGETWYDPV